MGRSINKKGQNSRKRMMEETAEETATRLEKAKNKRENESEPERQSRLQIKPIKKNQTSFILYMRTKTFKFFLACSPSTVQC